MNKDEPATTLRRVASARIPTKWGVLETAGFELESINTARQVETAVAIIHGNLAGDLHHVVDALLQLLVADALRVARLEQQV